MNPLEQIFFSVMRNDIMSCSHGTIFSVGEASICIHRCRSRRSSIPKDAEDWRIFAEVPPDAPSGEPWSAELIFSTRGGAMWSPAVHFRILSFAAPDTADETAIAERIYGWAMSL